MLGGGVDSTALELWLEGEEEVGFEWEEAGRLVVTVGLVGLLGARYGDGGIIDKGWFEDV